LKQRKLRHDLIFRIIHVAGLVLLDSSGTSQKVLIARIVLIRVLHVLSFFHLNSSGVITALSFSTVRGTQRFQTLPSLSMLAGLKRQLASTSAFGLVMRASSRMVPIIAAVRIHLATTCQGESGFRTLAGRDARMGCTAALQRVNA
jgi:hypothetical protein